MRIAQASADPPATVACAADAGLHKQALVPSGFQVGLAGGAASPRVEGGGEEDQGTY